MSTPTSDPQFSLQRVYVKDISFESPRSPGGFGVSWKPKIDLELNSRHYDLSADLRADLSANAGANTGADLSADADAGTDTDSSTDANASRDAGQSENPDPPSTQATPRKYHEVVLSLRVTAKNELDEVLYLVEVQQAGLFMARDIEGEALSRLLTGTCPGILFPYVRELLDSILTRGNFPPLMLDPVNFEALREHAVAQELRRQSEQEAAQNIH